MLHLWRVCVGSRCQGASMWIQRVFFFSTLGFIVVAVLYESAVADTCCITYHKKAAVSSASFPSVATRLGCCPCSSVCGSSSHSRVAALFLDFPSLVSFQNDGFDCCERDALMTHRGTPLTSQSVTFSLTTSHFSTKNYLVPGTVTYGNLCELCRVDPSKHWWRVWVFTLSVCLCLTVRMSVCWFL